MKLLRLSFFRIASHIQRNRMTFCLFFVGAMLSSFVFLYFYGNAMKGQISERENSVSYRMFEVCFDENVPLREAQLHVLDDYGIEEVFTSCQVTLPEDLADKQFAGMPQEVTAALYDWRTTQPDLFSSDIQGKTGVLADKIYGNDRTSMEINGIDFPILKRLDSGSGVLYVPLATYLQYFGETDYLVFQTKEILSPEEIQAANEQLKTAFPEASATLFPDVFMETDQQLARSDQINAALLYVVSLVSFLFLFQYMEEQNQMENVVYQIVGAKRRQIFGMILLEVGVLAAVACLLTEVLHAVFYEPVFSKLNMTETWITYSVKEYGVILLLTVMLALATAVPFFVSCLRETPVGLRRKYGR